MGRPKVEVAEERMRALNPDVEVRAYRERLSSRNALEIFEPYDLVIDGTDNFPTRYLSNDACVLLGKPNIYGSIFRFEGQASVFDARVGPCYRCLYPEPPPPGSVPSCAEGGVLGAAANRCPKVRQEPGFCIVDSLLLLINYFPPHILNRRVITLASYLCTRIFRPFKGCTGRLLFFIMFSNVLICDSDISIGDCSTNHLTPSEHGGVVNEPSYV